MSLVTRCTACGTLFKVVADQLKISDGWVRCGQCATIFDAQSNLVAEPVAYQKPAPPPVLAPTHKPLTSSDFAPAAHDESNSRSFGSDSIRDSSFNSQDREALLAAFSPSRAGATATTKTDAATVPASFDTQPATPTFSGFTSDFALPRPEAVASSPQPAQLAGLKTSASSKTPVDSPIESRLDSQSFRPGLLRDSGEIDSETGPSSSSWAASEYPAQKARPSDDRSISISAEPTTLNTPSASQIPSDVMSPSLPEVDLLGPSTTPTFVTQAQRAKRWRSPWVRLVLCLILLCLTAGLGLQMALNEKDRIAAQWPQTKAWLDQLCSYAGCQVQPFKRIESITVDSSSFNRINKNNVQLEAITQSYRLSVTLKNTGPLPVALPHVELSLQDAQDQPILRRVLSPADLGSSLQALSPSQDMAGSLTLQIDSAQLAGSRINGYRVLAFYP